MVVEASSQLASGQWWFVDKVKELSDDLAMGREVVLPARPQGVESVNQ
jgi:hypothetical protein